MSIWMVAAGCSDKQGSTKESYLAALNSKVKDFCEPAGAPALFDVPVGDQALKCGSFDDLIRLTDDMQKYDSQVEGIARRIERMYLEVDPSKSNDPMTEFKILSQTNTLPFDKYMREWKWDDAKYPKMKGLTNNLTLLLSVANKLDEEARNKSSQFTELKNSHANMIKKSAGNLMSRDLIDVLTPAVVQEGDCVQTAHLSTLIMILPKVGVEPFLKSYEQWAENVVPQSAKQFPSVTEEDGTQVWRIVLFKSSVDAFMKKAREERVTCRQFEYNKGAFEKANEQRAELMKQVEQQEKVMKGFCKASLSDVMVAWVHVKAMRIFVESVLRFGTPPNFAAFIIQPKDNQQAKARKALQEVLGKASAADAGADAAADEEDYFPYVSLSFTPFAAQRGF